MVVAGEASGDEYGGRLVRAIRARMPSVRFFGMGGPAMRQAGVHLLHRATHRASIGFVESMKDLPSYRRLLLRLAEAARRLSPNVCVLIDFPGFNLRLGPLVRRLGVPVVYYIVPAVWAWGQGRAHQVASFAERVLCAYEFEVPLYERAGARARWVGHPLLDDVPERVPTEQARIELGLDPQAGPVVALLPGSRTQEVERLLPVMLQAAGLARLQLPDLRFVVSIAPGLTESYVRSVAGRLASLPAVRWVGGSIWSALGPADFAVVASGTATLQTALWGIPMVVVYKLSSATYHLARRLVRLSHISLPNIVAGAPLVEEYLQAQAEPGRLAGAIVGYVRDAHRLQAMRERLGVIRARLGEPGAAERAADAVLEVMRP